MPYEIRKYDGTVLTTIGDGLTDETATSLTLIGKNVSNFGRGQNENLLHMLENFASASPPDNFLRGQVWYKTDEYKLKFYNTADWVPVAPLHYQAAQPSASHAGYLWFNTDTQRLFINVGSGQFELVGPETVAGYGTTRLVSEKLADNLGNNHAVIRVTIGNEVIGVISTTTFNVASTASISGVPRVYRGITLKSYTTTDVQLYGRTVFANLATTSTNIDGGNTGSLPYQSAPGKTEMLGIGSINTVVFSDGTNPIWKSLDTVTSAYATTSTNIFGGAQGSIPYQTAVGRTTFVGLGQEGQVLLSGATRPIWTNLSAVPAGTAVTATNASKLLSGVDSATYLYASTASNASTIAERTDQGELYATVFRGIATSAQYADLAENYLADSEYEVGTVMMVGGEREITASVYGKRAIGAVSGNPAYLMNSELDGGTVVALKGRVPVKIIGSVKRGDELIAADNGCAITAPLHSTNVFAVALESNDDVGVKLIEAVIL
jgi:hypothetical protein